MPATQYDILVEQGATFSLPIIYKDESGDPINLTDYEVRTQCREHHRSTNTIWSFDQNDPEITVTPASGSIDFVINATATAAFPAPLLAVWDLEIEDPSGEVIRLLEGRVRFTPEVTR